MNKLIKSAIVVSLGLSGMMTARAFTTGETAGDLIVGFSTTTGNDHVQDLGSSAALTNGMSWNLSSLLSGVTLTSVNWGVIGDATASDHSFLPNVSSTYDTIFTTSILSPAQANEGTFSQFNVGTGSLIQNFSTYSSGGPNAGDTLTIVATDDNSWNEQTLNGTHASQIVNAYGNPNGIGLTNISLWQVTANNTAPVLLGKLTLSSGGTLTFSTVSATNSAPSALFTGSPTKGFAGVSVVFTDASTGTITNRIWNFGNGRSVTNSTASSVTNTYAAAGSYTVTETVFGPGGSSTNSQTAYVVVSAAPKFGAPLLSGTNLVFAGANGPVGVQYRILMSTNLILSRASWTPVLTNTVSASGAYGFTNSATKPAAFFQLVSP